jgi:DDE superfamily endonuclease
MLFFRACRLPASWDHPEGFSATSWPATRAALPLSSKTLTYLAGIIRRHRPAIGSPWRALNPARQALLVLVHLRKGETFGGFAVGTTTAWRYVNEAVALLAAWAPKLRTAVAGAAKACHAYVILDGHPHPHRPGRQRPAVLLRQAPQERHEPAGHRQPGQGHPVDVRAAAWRGARQKAEWIWGVLRELEAAGLITLAGKGYQGSAHAIIPYKGKNKPQSQEEANRAHAKLRSPGEPANAQLKTWHILRKLRCCSWRAGQLAKAIHALQIHAG